MTGRKFISGVGVRPMAVECGGFIVGMGETAERGRRQQQASGEKDRKLENMSIFIELTKKSLEKKTWHDKIS
jgi:hypothetical protein